jgi:MFS family permease
MDRRLYFTLFLTITAIAVGASIILPLLPVYAQGMGAAGFQLGMIFSGFSFARTLFLPLVGLWSDQMGRRRLMLAGLIVHILVALGFGVASSVTQLVLLRILQGVGAATVIPIARAFAGDMTKPGEEGRLMGHFNMAFFGGLAIGPWIGGLLNDLVNIRTAFFTMAALSLFGYLLCVLNLPRGRTGLADAPPRPVSYWAMFQDPMLAAMFLFRFGSIIGLGMNWTFLPLYGHQELGLSATRIGFLVSVTVIMTTLLQPLFGRWSDRFNRVRMTFWGGALGSTALLFIPFCQSFGQLLLLNLVVGTAIGLYMPPLMALAVDAGRRTGFMTRVMSLMELAFSVGMVVGPLLAGLLSDHVGLGPTFQSAGSVGLAASFLFLFMTRKIPTP